MTCQFENLPQWKIFKSNLNGPKNYLTDNENIDLNLLVSAFLYLAAFEARWSLFMNMNNCLLKDKKYIIDLDKAIIR